MKGAIFREDAQQERVMSVCPILAAPGGHVPAERRFLLLVRGNKKAPTWLAVATITTTTGANPQNAVLRSTRHEHPQATNLPRQKRLERKDDQAFARQNESRATQVSNNSFVQRPREKNSASTTRE